MKNLSLAIVTIFIWTVVMTLDVTAKEPKRWVEKMESITINGVIFTKWCIDGNEFLKTRNSGPVQVWIRPSVQSIGNRKPAQPKACYETRSR